MAAAAQPSGQVTLVFSDIEGSTRLLEELGMDAYREALAEHRRIVRNACSRHSGYEVDYEGDAFFYAFSSAQEAVSAVSEAMAGLEEGPIRIRVGIHTGTPGLDPPKYVGLDVHFAARVMSSAHGGQVVLSASSAALIGPSGSEPQAFFLTDLGEHRLKDIAEAVPLFQLGEGSFPPLKTISNTNLPRPVSSFLGRERELAEVLARIEAGARLLTLTGPGGTGKTRLALEAASSLVPSYKAGVFWVGLATLRDPALLTETIAQTLGAKDGLVAHIQERELLLLLDNLEQVIEAAPELSGLLSACPNLTLLVTSRELLRVQGEVEYPVPPLAAPEAVSLFCERAQLEPSQEIAELCVRLDSLPLAVELAAARTKALSPAQILERLSGRLDLLTGGRDADPRQQTLRATIEWSYELLSGEEQRLFARLSVFAGGCTLEAAEEVAGASLNTLQSLVEKSLLRFSNERYWMLETIREYAFGRLDKSIGSRELPERHARHYLELVEHADPEIRDARDMRWLVRLENEQPNLRAALDHFLESDNVETALALAGALAYFWWLHGYIAEGRRWLDTAVALPPKTPTRSRARALNGAAALAVHAGDLMSGRRYSEESLEIWRALDDWDGIVRALNELGKVATAERQFQLAEQLFSEAMDLASERDPLWVVILNMNRAESALEHGDPGLAIALFEQTVADARALDYSIGLIGGLLGVGWAALARGERGRVRDAVVEALPIAFELGFKEEVFSGLELAASLIKGREPEEAARLLGAAGAMREEGGFASVTESRIHDRLIQEACNALGAEGAGRALEEGRLLEVEEAVPYALRLVEAA